MTDNPFKSTEDFMYRYRQLTDVWDRWPLSNAVVQSDNYAFVREMREMTGLAKNEIIANFPSYKKEGLTIALKEFYNDVCKNIEVYIRRKEEIESIDFLGINPESYTPGIIKTNWFTPIYEHSLMLKKEIEGWTNLKPVNTKKPKLNHKVIALFYYYASHKDNPNPLPRMDDNNCQEIAREDYQYTSNTSGNQILEEYYYYHIENNRVKKSKITLKYLRQVIEMLKDMYPTGYEMALKDLKTAEENNTN